MRLIPTLTLYLHTSLRYNPRTTDPLLELLSRLRQSRPSRLRSPCHVTVWEGAGWDHHVTLHLLLPAAVVQVVPASHRDRFSHSLRSDHSNGLTVSKIIVKKRKFSEFEKDFYDLYFAGCVMSSGDVEARARCCGGCITRTPHASLLALIMCWVGSGIFCGSMHRSVSVWHIADSFAQKPQYNKFRKRK